MKLEKNNNKKEVEIGKWIFYPEYGRFISQQGNEFFLDNRLRKLLQFLIERKEVIVKRDEIIDFVWNDVQVNEENLTKGIFDLRKLLKEKEITQIGIETIRNVGYRLNFKEEKTKTNIKPISQLILKSVFYFLLISSFLVLFIRAINYEN